MGNEKNLLEEIRSRSGQDLPHYSALFERSLSAVPPVYFAKEYEQFFWQCATTIPNWLPQVVAACAVTEGNGAHALLEIWSRVHGNEMAEAGLLQHAKDEAGHARLFVKLASLAFRNNYPLGNLHELEISLRPIGKSDLVKNADNPVSQRMLVDYMMQLNIVEIRTRKHLLMMAPMYYALAPDENKDKVEKILVSLENDEMSHIAYTAKVINNFIEDEGVRGLDGIFRCRLKNYNEHTIEHCDAAKHDYGQGKIPMLFAPACGGACRLDKSLQ